MRNFLQLGSSDFGGAASFVGGRLILQYKWQVANRTSGFLCEMHTSFLYVAQLCKL
jgi:hypothetical protein